MSLYEKIYNVMCDTESIDKSMTVGYGNNSYKAVSEKDMLNMIKPLLKKHRLVCLPIGGEMKESAEVFETSKGSTVRAITTLTARWKIVDIDTGESEVVYGFGQGADSQDKGAGKAYTYAYKNMFSKTFCIFSGEDTDNTHSDAITEQMTSKKKAKIDPAELEGISDYRQALIDFVKTTPMKFEEVASLYKLNKDSTQEDFKKALEDIVRNMP